MMLCARAKGTALVTDLARLENGCKAFIGWKHDATLGGDAKILDDFGKEKLVRQGGWASLDHVVTVDASDPQHLREYALAMADGDLWPGDEAAAELARRMTGKAVKFDPTFGAAPVETTKKKGT